MQNCKVCCYLCNIIGISPSLSTEAFDKSCLVTSFRRFRVHEFIPKEKTFLSMEFRVSVDAKKLGSL